MKYNEYSFEKIKEFIAEGQRAFLNYRSLEELLYSADYSLREGSILSLASRILTGQ